jgi:hypothetical protein
VYNYLKLYADLRFKEILLKVSGLETTLCCNPEDSHLHIKMGCGIIA